ncbi:MAG: hypothetical protein AB1646_00875 [Thermodesulfobacteriota bacterium]
MVIESGTHKTVGETNTARNAFLGNSPRAVGWIPPLNGYLRETRNQTVQ